MVDAKDPAGKADEDQEKDEHHKQVNSNLWTHCALLSQIDHVPRFPVFDDAGIVNTGKSAL
jgi:hypothetical protein